MIVTALLVALPVAAQADGAAKRQEPRVVIESLDGTFTTRDTGARRITSLAAEGAAFARFSGVERKDPADAKGDAKDRATFELAGGDRLAGTVIGGDGDLLRVRLTGGVDLDLSIDGLRSVVFPLRIPDSVTSAPGPGEDGDRLYLIAPGGSLDRAEGFVESFEEKGLKFDDPRIGAREFAWSRVAALFITPLEDEPVGDPGDGAKGERVSVSLVGGGRLSGDLVSIGAPAVGVTLRLGGAAEVTLPGAIVTEVALDDGSFRFLGDVAPSDAGSASPFDDDLGFRWPMRVDRNCFGGLLSVGGVQFARGLGVHAPSRVTWSLDAQWSELRLGCGLDDIATSGTRAGAARFRVVGDGKTLWQSDVLHAGGAAVLPDPIDVSGVKSLVLEVDPAGEFVLDRANWVRPILVRGAAVGRR